MRRLFLMRGLPASGKSTFIKAHGFEKLTLSADNIRLMFGAYSYDLDPEQDFVSAPMIRGRYDKRVWNLLFELLEERMLRGETVFVDATHYSRKQMTGYSKLKEKYKYKIYVVDFTDVPLEVCLERNKHRDYKRVPAEVIKRMHKEMLGSSVPSSFNVIKPDELINENEFSELVWHPTDLSSYKQVQVIGDIHSCYTALMDGLELENGKLRDDTFYVFTGDYFDRGLEHVETFKFITSLIGKENVVLLEGNHEIHWRNFVTGNEVKNHDTKINTFPPILSYLGNIYRDSAEEVKQAKVMKTISRFVKNLLPVFYFQFNGQYYLCNHGGITRDNRLSSIGFHNHSDYMLNIDVPEEVYVKGIGGYHYDIDAAWDHNNQKFARKIIQIHGHRNIGVEPIDKYKTSWNLEQGVEAGLNLGSVVITKETTLFKYTPNSVFNKKELERNLRIDLNTLDNETVRDILEHSPLINSKFFYEPRSKSASNYIKAYNFSRDAFRGQKWNKFSIMARGLFLDQDGDVVMRGYHKFFNLNENAETKLDKILEKVTYPIYAREKHDGYLGLSSFYKYENKPIFSSKGGSNRHGTMLEELIKDTVDFNKYKEIVKKYENVTFLFECIKEQGDMHHIVDYGGDRIFLLDAINNDYSGTFNMEAFWEMAALGFDIPREIALPDEESLLEYINNTMSAEGTEGAVLKDQNDYMFKLKTDWYSLWKSVRRNVSKLYSLDDIERANYINDLPDSSKLKTILSDINKLGILNTRNDGTKETDCNVKLIRNHLQEYYSKQ